MPIKTKSPVTRTAEVFDNIDTYDIRFRNTGDTWKCIIKYTLSTDSGERDEQIHVCEEIVTYAEIKKLHKLIAKITDGNIIGE
jgi:hypothetical protein